MSETLPLHHTKSRGSRPSSTTHSPTKHPYVNPGATSMHEDCGKCIKRVSQKAKAIQCDGSCKLWFHFSCVDLSQSLYESILKENQSGTKPIWVCNKCTAKTTVLRTVTELRVIENQLQELIVEVDRVVSIENTKKNTRIGSTHLQDSQAQARGKELSISNTHKQKASSLGKPMSSLIDSLEKKITELNIGIESLGLGLPDIPKIASPENIQFSTNKSMESSSTATPKKESEDALNAMYINSEAIAMQLAMPRS